MFERNSHSEWLYGMVLKLYRKSQPLLCVGSTLIVTAMFLEVHLLLRSSRTWMVLEECTLGNGVGPSHSIYFVQADNPVMLIEGALSIFVAILAYFLLPNWANNTPWLLPEETEMAQYRLVLSAGGIDEADSKLSMWDGAKLAAKDWVSCHRWSGPFNS
jgi:hypothetical protein